MVAVQRGFHEGRPDDDFEKHWLAQARADDVTCSGAWLPEDEFGDSSIPVATFAGFTKTLNTGLELLPLRMITDVTTSPAHRRRGLVRRLMETGLASAAADGVPVAALTASEATIYGRWGFGAATFAQGVEVDTGPRFGLRNFIDPGRVELIEPPDNWPVVRDVFDRFHAVTRGSVQWPQFYEVIHTGAYDVEGGGPDKRLRGVAHLDAAGVVDAVALYKYAGREAATRTVKVTEMMALNPTANLALWNFFGHIDLVNRVTFALAHPEDSLRWALTDINALSFTSCTEFLWLRVLDAERALIARPWTADGRLVLRVEDPQGHAEGRFEIETTDGVARVSRTEQHADVTLTAETLGSLYLGAVPVSTLHQAGRVGATDERAVARFAAMADLSVPPYCLTGF